MDDPIVAEVRAARERYAARFDFDLQAMFRDLQARERASGRHYLPAEPRPAEQPTEPSSVAR